VKKLLIVLTGCFSILAFSMAWGGDRDLFVSKCGACHKQGGNAAPINPADKAGLVWEKYFKRGRHPVDISSSISAAELQSIVNYLRDHAADSDQPEAAAIPK